MLDKKIIEVFEAKKIIRLDNKLYDYNIVSMDPIHNIMKSCVVELSNTKYGLGVKEDKVIGYVSFEMPNNNFDKIGLVSTICKTKENAYIDLLELKLEQISKKKNSAKTK